jgi:hypothetical protein
MEPKALPPAKINPAKLLKGSPLIPTVKRISAKSVVDDNRSLELGIVKRQVIQISDLIKTNTILKAKEEERKKKESEKKRFAEREEKLEKPKEDKGDKIKLPSLPRLGFFDRIKKFLFNIFLGYISLRLLPYLPKLAGVVNTIVKVQDTVIDVSGKILNGLVSFVDKAYEVHDKTRKFLGNLGGENFTKAFDGFVGAMDKVITASIIAAIAFGELRDRSYPDDRGKKPGKRPKVTTSRGGEAGKPNIRNPLRQRPKVTTGKGGKLRLPKGIKSRGGLLGLMFLIPDLIDSGMLVSQGRGKDGLRTLLSAVAGTVAGIGAYSATIAGAGALGATGVGLPTAIALAVAGFAASSLAGNAAYNLADAALRKMGLVDKDPKTNKPYQYAGGGSVTRGGKYTGPIKRTIQKSQAKRTLKVKPTEVKPGQSVGGKDKIEKIFPEVKSKDQTKNVNPLGYMKSSYKTASSTPGLGGLIGILMKAQLGERPSSADYQSAADGLTAWVQRTVGGGIQRTGGAFAEGGEVDVGMFGNDADMKNVIAKALQDSVAPKVDDILNDLKKQLGLKGMIEQAPTMPGQQPAGMGIAPTGGTLTMEQLVGIAKGAGFSDDNAVIAAAIAMAESGGNSNAHNPKPPDNSYGLWQINMIGDLGPARRQQYGLSSNEQLFDPVTNAKIAFRISGGSNFSPWTTYTGGKYKSHLASAQAAKSAPPLKTSPVMTGGPGMDGYITGDPSSPNYDPSHGGSNYHDHLSFKDRATAERAYKFFMSKGFQVTEFKGYGRVGRHSPGSMHYSGLAFDIPGSQVPVGQERQMSARVRSTLSQFRAMASGGKVHGFTRAILGEKGPEFVIDADSTRALEENYPGFLNALNKSNYQGALNVIRSYASYEQGATIRAIVDEKLIPVPVPVGSSQQSSMMVSIFDEVEDYMASSYKGK